MPRESKAAKAQRAREISRRLRERYPNECALEFSNPWELLVATILSAQCTDERVNQVTADLFIKYPTVADYASADPEQFSADIYSTGFYRNKTKSILGAAGELLERFDGEVPPSMEQMLTLPGVARKTANVVLGTGFGIPSGIAVDTHVTRLALRMGLTSAQKTKTINTDRIEQDLMEVLPAEEWVHFGHAMIWHGRRVCDARRPQCEGCPVDDLCPRRGVK